MDGTQSSSLDDLVSYCVAHQLANRVQFELAHDVGAMRFRCFYANSESDGHFFTALPFREQLHDFALSRSKPAAEDGHVIRDCILFAEPVEQHVRRARSKK